MQRNPVMRRLIPAAVLAFAAGAPLPTMGAEDPGPGRIRAGVAAYLDGHRGAILEELTDLLSIPNLASDLPNIRKNADLLASMLRRRGVEVRLLEIDGGPPVVFGTLTSPGARRTIVLYMHYDGQPVAASAWASDPWRPVLRDAPLDEGGREVRWSGASTAGRDDWRLYARSASDDKAPIVAMLAALDALRETGITPSVNLKFFLEGEEEAGSPNLGRFLRRYRELLAADLWLMCDGPVHQSRRMQVFFGARGIVGLEMTLYGPLRPLHSGHYGNWAPNPIALMADLLASMRDPDGRILIPGYHDDVRPVTAMEREALARIPDERPALRDALALGREEGGGATIEALVMRPALNLRGIRGGAVGPDAANAIPTEATASIDLRLVPDQTPEKTRARVEAFLIERGFHLTGDEPDARTRRAHQKVLRLQWGHGYPPARTALDLPMSRALTRVLEDAVGTPVVAMPTLGGSGPLYLIQEILATPSIGVPIVNHDNNQHAPDENLRLRNLWDGVALYAGLLARLGHEWQGTGGEVSGNESPRD